MRQIGHVMKSKSKIYPTPPRTFDAASAGPHGRAGPLGNSTKRELVPFKCAFDGAFMKGGVSNGCCLTHVSSLVSVFEVGEIPEESRIQ